METWKILVISLAAAVVLGTLGGIFIGKYAVKRARSNSKPVLSKKERIIYAACMLIGTASILFGVFFKWPVIDGSANVNGGDISLAENGGTGGNGVVTFDTVKY